MGRPKKPPRLDRLKGKGPFLYIIDGKTTISTGTEDAHIGQQKLADYVLRSRGFRIAKEHHEVFVSEILIRYGNHQKQVNPDAFERFKYSLRRLQPFWKLKTAAEVEPETLADYIDYREDEHGAAIGTIRRELGDLRSAISHAVSTRRLKPFPEIKLPTGSEPKDRWLRIHEEPKLLKAAENLPTSYNVVLFIKIGLWSGARKRAILDLKWNQIDFDQGFLDFNARGAKRTKKRKSRIPMNKPILQILRQRFDETGKVSEYVFHQKRKPSLRVKDVTRGFQSACRQAGLLNVSPHTLRHTCATRMAQRGESLRDAAEFLKMTIETLTRIYAHHNPEHMRGISDRNSSSDLLPRNSSEQAEISEKSSENLPPEGQKLHENS